MGLILNYTSRRCGVQHGCFGCIFACGGRICRGKFLSAAETDQQVNVGKRLAAGHRGRSLNQESDKEMLVRFRAIFTAVLGLVAVSTFAISKLPLPAEFF